MYWQKTVVKKVIRIKCNDLRQRRHVKLAEHWARGMGFSLKLEGHIGVKSLCAKERIACERT